MFEFCMSAKRVVRVVTLDGSHNSCSFRWSCYSVHHYFLVFARAVVRVVVVWYTVHYWCSTSDKWIALPDVVGYIVNHYYLMFAKWVVGTVDVWQKSRSLLDLVEYIVNHYYLVFAKGVVGIADVWPKSSSLLDVVGYIVHHYCLMFAKGVVGIVPFNVS